jgi:hypothetical protein
MADIFISYSKADHPLALKLSAFLEAEGWSVWWDRNLSAGEVYRDEIMRELSAARAVIVIWTQTSIKSDWARAEAGRAKAEGKLIPVKAPGLTYSDIPLPFGEMHTENVTDTDLIRAAVVAQLSKPATAPSTLWLVTRTMRLQLLTWAGIVGGSVTIFSNLRGFLNLADWARWIATHWHEWTRAFWTAAFSWIGIHIHHSFVPLLSFTAFLVMVVIGTILRTANPTFGDDSAKATRSKAQLLESVAGRLGIYVLWFVAFLGVMAVVRFYVERFGLLSSLFGAVLLPLILSATFMLVSLAAVIWASKKRPQCLELVTLLGFFWIALAYVPNLSPVVTSDSEMLMFGVAAFLSLTLLPIGIIVIDLLAPVKSINRRLLFLAMGTFLLVALNKISMLTLHRFIEAPAPPV